MAYHTPGRAKDITESLRLHHEAAKRGNADALFELFLFAVHGIGDEKRAIYYLKEAAMRDQPRACANLGALYAIGASQALSASKGQTDKIDRDLSEAIKWYTRAADLGAGEAAASLGVMALRGEGMPNDPKVAKEFLRRAEELGFDVDAFLRLS